MPKELSLALSDGLRRRRIKVLPLRLDDAQMPASLSDIFYVRVNPGQPGAIAERILLDGSAHLGIPRANDQDPPSSSVSDARIALASARPGSVRPLGGAPSRNKGEGGGEEHLAATCLLDPPTREQSERAPAHTSAELRGLAVRVPAARHQQKVSPPGQSPGSSRGADPAVIRSDAPWWRYELPLALVMILLIALLTAGRAALMLPERWLISGSPDDAVFFSTLLATVAAPLMARGWRDHDSRRYVAATFVLWPFALPVFLVGTALSVALPFLPIALWGWLSDEFGDEAIVRACR